MAFPANILDKVEGFQWDESNLRKIAARHDVSHLEVEQIFVNSPLLLLKDDKHSESEERFHAYGKSHDGRLLQVAFTLRDEERLIRPISARPMSRKERVRYAEEI